MSINELSSWGVWLWFSIGTCLHIRVFATMVVKGLLSLGAPPILILICLLTIWNTKLHHEEVLWLQIGVFGFVCSSKALRKKRLYHWPNRSPLKVRDFCEVFSGKGEITRALRADTWMRPYGFIFFLFILSGHGSFTLSPPVNPFHPALLWSSHHPRDTLWGEPSRSCDRHRSQHSGFRLDFSKWICVACPIY
jgi:hypothetical protein